MADDAAPTAILVHEHAEIGPVVAAMQRESEHIRATGEIDADAVRQMVEFTRGFTDGSHHVKEETLLFPCLLEHSPQARSPVSMMLREHEAARARIAAIAASLADARAGDADARRLIADSLAGYASLLMSHIAKENNVLFPLAERALDGDDKRRLDDEFRRLQSEEAASGSDERYRAMAQSLARPGV